MIPTHEADKLKIHFEIEIEAPPARVWEALTTKELMNEWFSKSLTLEVKEGGQFRMLVNYGGEGEFTFFGEVLRVAPEEELAFTWTEHEKGKDPWPVSTLVSFKLRPIDKGTLVTLTHTGFEALKGALAKEEYESHIEGWTRSETLADLKRVVEANL